MWWSIMDKFLPFIGHVKNFLIFFSGFFCGFFICFLIYIFCLLKNFNKKFYSLKTENNEKKYSQVNDLILKTQNQFTKDIQQKKNEFFDSLLRNSQSLALQIACDFYPNSPFPYLELTIDESLALIKYIHERIEKLFDQKIIFIFKKMTLRRIIILKQKLIDQKYIEKTKKTHKLLNICLNTVNCFNPLHWTKKLFLNKIYKTIFNKIGCAIILIVGEELYKVYSKQLFKGEQDTTQELQNFLDELRTELDAQTKVK
ncbi:hypothetical protein [Candidatus Phytoplasma phoenicium]|uniref:Transmembrane protein n=1 Tax=Candidatus Phytoplasma phoenicium TaxID=198422 RepID=A0A0L0ML67_9MOLU|nr:hypothetical protein [Candidatus Phytoplasma phoenicium]KND62749.1 hypothetical protein AlmWB_00500 [Candidatus Phytoplasma phoenicium]